MTYFSNGCTAGLGGLVLAQDFNIKKNRELVLDFLLGRHVVLDVPEQHAGRKAVKVCA